MHKSKSLAPGIINIVQNKGTEHPHTGQYNQFDGVGTYLCRQCGLALFRSSHKFLSSCGWPSFDDELADAIKRLPDADGSRTEILCKRCDAHLGHVFLNEGSTTKNLRHCVNSLAIDFISNTDITDTEEAIFAGGCFWGIQYKLDQLAGVLHTEVGYTHGTTLSPSYAEVCSGSTGHLESVRVIYDPQKINYETLTKTFLEMHDPTQKDRQGPDVGRQYASAIFYFDEQQKIIAEKLLDALGDAGKNIVTILSEVSVFWPAEESHQKYHEKHR